MSMLLSERCDLVSCENYFNSEISFGFLWLENKILAVLQDLFKLNIWWSP